MRWLKNAKICSFKRQVMAAALAALAYNIWQARNGILWNATSAQSNRIVTKTKIEVEDKGTNFAGRFPMNESLLSASNTEDIRELKSPSVPGTKATYSREHNGFS
uniref:Uncharacterized protein n=1 Tax=Cannabis sativa TaxID=3483 RepID=A0A803QDL7_CANSA